MGKLVLLKDMMGTWTWSGSGHHSSTTILMFLLLMALGCVGNHGSQVRATFQEDGGIEIPPPVASPLKQPGDDGASGGGGGGMVNGGRAGIESYGNVTVLAGQRGEMKCRTFNLANYTILWLRHRDTHLLSAGSETYTAESRFRPFQHMYTWGLRISDARISDGGVYECQISTTPPISAFTYLTVVEPVTHIEGLNGRGSELFIKAGSTINLTCLVEDATDNAPKHILWKHNSRIVNFEWSRGGMSLVTEKKSKGVTVSRLLIQKAVRSDSGTYQCAPHNAHPASVKIHVLEQGEKQAAMHSACSPTQDVRAYIITTVVLLLHFLLAKSFHHNQVFVTNYPITQHCSSSPSQIRNFSKSSTSTLQNNLRPVTTTAHTKLLAGRAKCDPHL